MPFTLAGAEAHTGVTSVEYGEAHAVREDINTRRPFSVEKTLEYLGLCRKERLEREREERKEAGQTNRRSRRAPSPTSGRRGMFEARDQMGDFLDDERSCADLFESEDDQD